MRFILIPVLFFSFQIVFGQDTIRLMQYNLLMYGNDFGGCNQSNNSVENKNEYLKVITGYIKPDILAVNEIYRDEYYHDLLLNNVFNINGIDYFKRGYPPNTSNSYTVNNVFYDSRKLELVSNSATSGGVRDIDIFRFKYIEGAYADSNVLLNCAVAHLKAGNSSGDEQHRANQTYDLMLYLNNDPANYNQNFTMSGDFNLYTGAEEAFQNLLFFPNESIRFYDPVDRIGNWNNNSNFADVHTQSTHTNGDCFSGGGLDDRFDFILASDELMEGTRDIHIAEGSYRAVGQDGQHFNSTIVSAPDNQSAPPAVISALYTMSDHLPVVVDLVVGKNMGIEDQKAKNLKVTFSNPVDQTLSVHYTSNHPDEYFIQLTGMMGQQYYAGKRILAGSGTIDLPVHQLKQGIYVLTFTGGEETPVFSKVMIRHQGNSR